ncbi:MAG: hypothetical protein AW12_00851 [Candidatus Accumulibacter sp. BA-94]|uniref:DUF3164 family protein n=1 Tax=Accumulibacter sp. TaxID=2053492 RepID=UPI00044C180A|nr:DUF3164 family protein [Accumulibacter sp.]EXI92108.1 MAG: hypothetical protein AW12_00851 [Candidatus Accumulibacter sp. BA-94]HRD86795.1 DUF3164 family protein [Accumulibacter sp.]
MPNASATAPIHHPGYMQNSVGHLVSIDMIKPIDIERDKLVLEIVDKARVLNAHIRDFKTAVFGDINAFIQLSAEEYGVQIGGNKGNVALVSFNGRYKILRAISESIRFDERLQAAKALIDECITDWSQGSRSEIKVLVNDSFKVDQQGNINTGRVLSLRRLEISDPRWQKAMQALSESVLVVDSKSYIRVYERDAKGEYQQIALDVSAA